MPHAYLIMAHNDPDHLRKLIKALDDKRNDIYIHIDSKSDQTLFADIRTSKGHLQFIPDSDRKDVCWGDPSQIDTEYTLFKSAYTPGKYSRYHLLSGVDFPLKSQEEIHQYFHQHLDEEFIDIEGSETEEGTTKTELYRKCHLYHFFLPFIRSKNRFVARLANLLRRSLMLFQIILKVNRKFTLGPLYKGSNWGSFTEEFIKTLLENEMLVKHEFRHTHCCDEVYKQTIAKAGNFKISPAGNLRYIDFGRGTRQSPYTFRPSDLMELQSRPEMFARKFSSSISGSMCDHIISK